MGVEDRDPLGTECHGGFLSCGYGRPRSVARIHGEHSFSFAFDGLAQSRATGSEVEVGASVKPSVLSSHIRKACALSTFHTSGFHALQTSFQMKGSYLCFFG